MTPPRQAAIGVLGGVAVALAACAHEAAPVSSAPPPLPPATKVACHHVAPTCTAPAPSYARDVRPILERRCFTCHAGGGAAADEHDFSHIETLRAQRRALTAEIDACAMPPPPEAPVPDSEADVLLRWAACGESD